MHFFMQKQHFFSKNSCTYQKKIVLLKAFSQHEAHSAPTYTCKTRVFVRYNYSKFKVQHSYDTHAQQHLQAGPKKAMAGSSNTVRTALRRYVRTG